MSWKLAAAAQTLRKQVNTRYPKRDKSSDGTIGDQAHRRRISDHNPDRTGYVMALDIDEDFGSPGAAQVFADQLMWHMRTSGDKRIKNIVYEGKVASGTYADKFWVWRSQPRLGHKHHIHISFDQAAKHDGRPFPLPMLELPKVGLRKSDSNPPTSSSAVNATVTPAKKAPAKKAAKPKP
jgi:hypothetical protein